MNSAEPQTAPLASVGASLKELLWSWRYLIGLLALALLIFLYYAEENWRGKWAWERYKRQQEARGARFDPAAFIPPAAADGENFAMTPALAPLLAFVPGTQQWRDTNALARIQNFGTRYGAASQALTEPKTARSNSWVAPRIGLVAWYAAFLTNQPGTRRTQGRHTESVLPDLTNEEAAAGVLEQLAEFAPLLEELRLASQRPRCRFDLRYSHEDPAAILLPHLAVLKQLSQVLALRVQAELARGQADAAFDDLELMLYLADATREEPFLISQLVRISQFQIALQPFAAGLELWSEPQLRALQKRLQRVDFCADVKHGLEAERAFLGAGYILSVRRNPQRALAINSSPADSDFIAPLLAIVPEGWFYLEQLNYCRHFDEELLPAIDASNRRISPEASRQLQARLDTLSSYSPAGRFFRHQFYSSLMLPSLANLARRTAFAQTAAHCAALACALQRYRLAHGEFPDSLAALNPQFIERPPRDVINGQPLKYWRTPESRYILYSVGWNETDDGGLVVNAKRDEGSTAPQGDWVWQLDAAVSR